MQQRCIVDKFITRCWGDGTDFIDTDLFRSTTGKAARSGLGDMIGEFSNLYAQSTNATILTDKTHVALADFTKLVDMDGRSYYWEVNKPKYNLYAAQSTDNESLSDVSQMKILFCYNDFDYVRLVKSRFVKTDIPDQPYGTFQKKGISKKCGYDRPHVQRAIQEKIQSYNMPFINVDGLEKLGLAKIAYILDNAQVHVGIDSGMTHLANTIKDKNQIDIIVPKDRITGVSYRWINNDFRVSLI